jgi:hypothetical protein
VCCDLVDPSAYKRGHGHKAGFREPRGHYPDPLRVFWILFKLFKVNAHRQPAPAAALRLG